MTTGRINQVTIGGRGSARPTHKMRLPAARHPPHGLGCPRFAKPNTRLSLQSLPHRTPTAGRPRAALRPVVARAGAVRSQRSRTGPTPTHTRIASHAKWCNHTMPLPAPDWTTQGDAPPKCNGTLTDLLSKPGNASAG